MKHAEVRELYQQTEALIAHLIEQRNTNFHVNLVLARARKDLMTEIELIESTVNARLKELEMKAFELGGNNHTAGLSKLSPEELIERNELYAKFEQDMQAESSFVLNAKIDPDKCSELKIEFAYTTILSKFF